MSERNIYKIALSGLDKAILGSESTSFEAYTVTLGPDGRIRIRDQNSGLSLSSESWTAIDVKQLRPKKIKYLWRVKGRAARRHVVQLVGFDDEVAAVVVRVVISGYRSVNLFL